MRKYKGDFSIVHLSNGKWCASLSVHGDSETARNWAGGGGIGPDFDHPSGPKSPEFDTAQEAISWVCDWAKKKKYA